MLLPQLRYRTMLLICLVSLLVLWFVPFPPQHSTESLWALGGAARALVVGR